MIGQWRLLPAQNLLLRDDSERRLEPRHADLLVYLAENAGKIVSADDINAAVWGGQVVSDHALYQAIAKLRKAFGDDAASPRFIETVPKRGYRLVADVQRLRTAAETSNNIDAGRQHREQRTRWTRWIWLGVVLVAMLLATLYILHTKPAGDGASPPRILVLPFDSLSPEEADDLIAEGFAIELAHALGGVEGIQIIGPASARMALSEADMTSIGQRTGADAIVSGNLRRGDGQLRIAANLTNAADGRLLWSEIYARDDRQIFAIQTEIADMVVSALENVLGIDDVGEVTAVASHDLKAYEYYLLGQHHRHGRSQASLQRAIALLNQAIAIEADYVDARAELAAAHLLSTFYGDVPLKQAVALAEPHLQQALQAAPDNAEVLGVIGLSHYLQGAFGLAEEYLHRATDLNPNHAEGWTWLGLAQRQQGKLNKAIVAFTRAHDLEPLLGTTAINLARAMAWTGHAGQGEQLLLQPTSASLDKPQTLRVLSGIALETGDLVNAHKWAERALDMDPSDELSRINLAMILAFLGQDERAAPAVAALQPGVLAPGRAAQDLLDRLALAAPQLLPTDFDGQLLDRLRDTANIPEIDWRLANARVGMALYFNGDFASAAEHLHKAMDGREHAVLRSDRDVFVCTALDDSLRRIGDAETAAHWAERCADDYERIVEHGWRTLVTAYVEARLAMLNDAHDTAFVLLERMVGNGFRNPQLLTMDPLLAPLRSQPRFKAVVSTLTDLLHQAWQEIDQASNRSPTSD